MGGREIKRHRQNSAAEGTHPRELTQTAIQCNPLNGSPDNGSIRLLVQIIASPILYYLLYKLLLDNASIRLLVHIFASPNVEPLSGLHCNRLVDLATLKSDHPLFLLSLLSVWHTDASILYARDLLRWRYFWVMRRCVPLRLWGQTRAAGQQKSATFCALPYP